MKFSWFNLLFGTACLALLLVGGAGCASTCGEGEVESCQDFQTTEKNGFIADCICIQEECSSDDQCDPGFFCDSGLCVAN